MIIDVHTHFWPREKGYSSKWFEYIDPSWIEMLRRHRDRYKEPSARAELMPLEWEDWIEELRSGVDKAVIMGIDVTRIWRTKIVDEAIFEVVNKYPDLFIGFASTEPVNEKGRFKMKCVEDLEIAVKKYGLKGVKLYPTYGNYYPNDEVIYPLYEKIVELDIPLMFHQSWLGYIPKAPSRYAQVYLLDEVLENYPQLRIAIAHLGYPWTEELFCLMRKASPTEVYADISGLFGRPFWLTWQLVMAKEYGVLDRIMFGTDAPGLCRPPKKWVDWCKNEINKIASNAGWPTLTEEEINGLLGGNAARWLRL